MYNANQNRYDSIEYKKCGESGLKLPAVSLGLWHNFGNNSDYDTMCKMCFTAFDNGITHFDLANNYGPEAGCAETNFGKILNENFKNYRAPRCQGSLGRGYDRKRGSFRLRKRYDERRVGLREGSGRAAHWALQSSGHSHR